MVFVDERDRQNLAALQESLDSDPTADELDDSTLDKSDEDDENDPIAGGMQANMSQES